MILILFLHCRNKDWKGLSQFVNLTAGVRYSMSGYVKLLNTVNNALYHPVDIVMGCSNDQGKSFSFSLHGPLGSQCEFLVRTSSIRQSLSKIGKTISMF